MSNELIEPLTDISGFRARRAAAWARNSSYWLSNPLRHVVDTGDLILDTIEKSLIKDEGSLATVVDMGCGSAWVAKSLEFRSFSGKYIGVDSNQLFVDQGRLEFAQNDRYSFQVADLEQECDLLTNADLVLNAFTFFELTELDVPMKNAARMLRSGGKLLVVTIDKIFLILAISGSWQQFHENLERYERIKGAKYAFQAIDLGDRASEALEYPSVLYSVDDFIVAGEAAGLHLSSYSEKVFTAKPIPKIYLFLEFTKE